jgi:hypothetical protein
MRRLAERLLLGTIMAMIAAVLDRRLRRMFKPAERATPVTRDGEGDPRAAAR